MNPQEEINNPSYSSISFKDVTVKKLKLLAFSESPLTFQEFNNLNNCLICRKTDVGSVRTHLETDEHNLVAEKIFPYRKLSRFHQFWLRQHKSYQSNRNYFIPLFKKRLRCVVCNCSVMYGDIPAHLSDHGSCTLLNNELSEKYVEEKIYENQDKDMDGLSYSSLLFEDVTEEKLKLLAFSENPLTFQKFKNSNNCLICLEINVGPVCTHLKTDHHRLVAEKREVAYMKLSCFHQFWLRQDKSYQSNRNCFIPKSLHRVKCLVCNCYVKYEDMLAHLGGHGRSNNKLSEVDVEEMNKTVVETNHPQEETNGPSYSSYSLEDVTVPKLKLLAFSESPLTFHKLHNFNNCLICRKFNVGPVGTHLESDEHRWIARKKKTFKKLSRFHKFWLRQHEVYQSNRSCFLPESSVRVQCLACNRSLMFKEISEHLNDHGRCMLGNIDLSEKEVEDIFVLMDYPADINMMFYPIDLINQVHKADRLIANTIQRQLQNTHCLLCQRILIGTFTTVHVIRHVSSLVHKGALQNSANIDALYAYHNFWKQQSTVTIQAKQMYFIPLDKDRATCLKCGISFLYDDIISHVLTNCQQCTDSNSINAKFIIKQSSSDVEEKEDGIDGSAECSSNEEEYLVAQTAECGSNEEEDYLAAESANIDFMEIKQSLEEINAQLGKIQLQLEKIMLHLEKNCSYSENTMNLLYKRYINCRGVKPISYCIQYRSGLEIYCLLCRKHVIDRVAEHLPGKKHLKNCTNTSALTILEQYHRFWMRQTNEKQLLQVRFNTDTIDSMVCVSCNQQIPMKQVMVHPCLTLENVYHNYKVPEEYQEFNNTYDAEVFKVFFSSLERSASEKIFNTKLPLLVSFTNLAYCLLCRRKVYRHPKLWYYHLLEHTADMESVVAALPFVAEYHQFWKSQVPSKQIYLIHYVPLNCVKGHQVPYDQVFEHMENCRVEKLEQVKKRLKNVLWPASPKNCVRDTEQDSNDSDCDLSVSELSSPVEINLDSDF